MRQGGTGQNITVLAQRDSLSFVHPLSICPSWERGCFKFSPCGMVPAGFPLVSGVRRAAQREAGFSSLDPTLALVISYPPQVWARFLSVVKMSSVWISQSLCFLAFDSVSIRSCLPKCRTQRGQSPWAKCRSSSSLTPVRPLPTCGPLCPRCPAAPSCLLPLAITPACPVLCRTLVTRSPATQDLLNSFMGRSEQ